MLKRNRQRVFALWLAFAAVATQVCAPAFAQILNSERIEQTFGSYGIDVLYSDESLRLSNLYSVHDGQKVTRTIAVVEYPRFVDPAFQAEHDAILAGASIGSTLADAGWEVVKVNTNFSEVVAPDQASRLMRINPGSILAVHLYRLEIRSEYDRFDYATILEMHHPAYLSYADLTSIYTLDPRVAGPGAAVRNDLSLLLAGQRILAELDLALGE